MTLLSTRQVGEILGVPTCASGDCSRTGFCPSLRGLASIARSEVTTYPRFARRCVARWLASESAEAKQ